MNHSDAREKVCRKCQRRALCWPWPQDDPRDPKWLCLSCWSRKQEKAEKRGAVPAPVRTEALL